MQLSIPVNISGNEIMRTGDEQGSTRTITNTQTTKALQEKMAIQMNMTVMPTPEMDKAFKDGMAKMKSFLEKNGAAMPINDSQFFKKNPRIKGVRPELVWAFERTWHVGYRLLIVEGPRSVEKQKLNVKKGASQTMDSLHLRRPLSWAADYVPIEKGTNRLMWADKKAYKTRDLNQYSSTSGAILMALLAGKEMFGWKGNPQFGHDWNCRMTVYSKTSLRDWAHVAFRDDKKGCKKSLLEDVEKRSAFVGGPVRQIERRQRFGKLISMGKGN